MNNKLNKERLRRSFLKLREELSDHEAGEKSSRICRRLFELSEFKSARMIVFYMSKGKEVRTAEAIQVALKTRKRVLLPAVINSRELRINQVYDIENDLTAGTWGILEPKEHLREFSGEEIQGIVVVPGIVFDRHGGRVGFGKGFYDRFLKNLPQEVATVGLCYSFQIENGVLPLNSNDIKIDVIVTEDCVIRC